MHEFKLKFFDSVMTLVRKQEARYLQYAAAPPRAGPGGLFGLGLLLDESLEPGIANALASPQQPPSLFVVESLLNEQKEHLTIIEHLGGMLELSGALDRAKVFRGILAGLMPTYESCFQEWKALRQQLDEELNRRLVFYVGQQHGEYFTSMDDDWGAAFLGFPSIRSEVERGLKCFAFEQHTATVFHLMRVAEQGLRAVAKERKVKLPKDRPIEDADWGTLTTRLRAQVDIVNNWPAKKAGKKVALPYYTGVLADVVFFKDRYRNMVSHSLTVFDEPEARRVILRVCDFMRVVASRTNESGKRVVWRLAA